VTSNATKPEGCVFCAVTAPGIGQPGDPERDALVLVHGRDCYVILNLYPYNNGHLMVVPRHHASDPAQLSGEEYADLNALVLKTLGVLRELYHPEGFNLGMNLGQVAGAGIADHVHHHVVPRWNGDTNFMPVLGETKVMNEHLERSQERLKAAFDRALGSR
jgi:ATP adenylyltransferase